MKRPETAEEILAWLNDFGHRIDFQHLSSRVLREKNRVIVQYRVSSGAIATVGGRDLQAAVIKAAVRLEFFKLESRDGQFERAGRCLARLNPSRSVFDYYMGRAAGLLYGGRGVVPKAPKATTQQR
jgi:hypothetical protein